MTKTLGLLLLIAAAPAWAAGDAAAPFRLSGDLRLDSDFRFRGVSQSNLLPAAGGGLTVTHRSGLYLGADVTTVAGWGSVGGAPVQLLLAGGYAGDLGAARLDAGVTWYLYPGGAGPSSFGEARLAISGAIGPATLTGGIAWAPPQTALGNWYGTPQSRPGSRGSNLYVRADTGIALLGTPLTLVGHVGHSRGSEGLGPQGWALAPTGAYWDWRLGVDYGAGPVTLGLAWVSTDLGPEQPAPGGSQAVVSVTAAF